MPHNHETPLPLELRADVAEILSAAQADATAISFHMVSSAIHALRREQKLTGAANESVWVDAVAFDLTDNAYALGPWRTYFGPNGSGVDGQGNEVFFPDVGSLDTRALDLWEARLGQATHPAVIARYADLLWDFAKIVGGRRQNVQHARTAIAAYERMAAEKVCHELFGIEDAMLRMLSLAITIRAVDAIDRARTMLLGYHRSLVADADRVDLSVVDTLLWGRGVGLSQDDYDGIIVDLEALLGTVTSPGAEFDPFYAEHLVDRLRRHYSRQKSQSDLRRVHSTLGAAFEAVAGMSNAMAAASHLDKALVEYGNAADSEAFDRVRIARADAIERSRDEMTEFSSEISISASKMEEFLDKVVDDDPIHSLVRIANLFPSVENLRDVVLETAKVAPVQAFISISIQEDEHIAAVIGSVDDDMDGRIMHTAGQHVVFDGFQLNAALNRFMDRHSPTAYDLAGMAGRLGAFDDTSIIAEGIQAWLEADWLKCLHVLVPHIEGGVRRILKGLGQPIVKDHQAMPGRQILLNMAEVLSNEVLQQAMGPDIVLFYRARFVDPRAKNLRNVVAHGLVGQRDASQSNCDMLIQSLLLLGCWREIAVVRRKHIQGGTD